jgi:hypothetical protein
MKATVGIPIKLNYRNSYEGGLQGPCTAEVIDTTVQPPELGTVKDGVFTANVEGAGKLITQFIYPDGMMNSYEVSVSSSKPQVVEVVKSVGPKITGGTVFDPDSD